MIRTTLLRLSLATAMVLLAPLSARAQEAQPAAAAFERLAGLAGEWIDVDGSFGAQGQVVVTYRLTASGSAVIETMHPGTRHEMVSVYHRDGEDLVLTHYCSAGNQPRMRVRTFNGRQVAFAFDGGTSLDPSTDMHMHASRMEFVSPDEIRGEWEGWNHGAPGDHLARYHLVRKTS